VNASGNCELLKETRKKIGGIYCPMDITGALPGVRQEVGSKLYGTHQLLVYADDPNVLGEVYIL